MIQRQLAKLGVSVYARTHVHSTAAADGQLTEALKSFLVADPKMERSKAKLAITLIWVKGKKIASLKSLNKLSYIKNIISGSSDEPSLMVSPSAQSAAIQGEANIVRYLIRLLPSLLDYEGDTIRAVRLDQLLDLTDATAPLGAQGAKKDRAPTLQQLDKILGSRKEPNAMDFVLYSALVNSAGIEKEIAGLSGIRSWWDRCRSSAVPVKHFFF